MERSTATKPRESRLRIGDVASKAGVNIETLRYYERRGILRSPKRSSAGYREYPTDTVRLIRFIKRAQELGFTLDEIEDLVALRQTPRRWVAMRVTSSSVAEDPASFHLDAICDTGAVGSAGCWL